MSVLRLHSVMMMEWSCYSSVSPSPEWSCLMLLCSTICGQQDNTKPSWECQFLATPRPIDSTQQSGLFLSQKQCIFISWNLKDVESIEKTTESFLIVFLSLNGKTRERERTRKQRKQAIVCVGGCVCAGSAVMLQLLAIPRPCSKKSWKESPGLPRKSQLSGGGKDSSTRAAFRRWQSESNDLDRSLWQTSCNCQHWAFPFDIVLIGELC